jgi:SAM-dependent methyltransferase
MDWVKTFYSKQNEWFGVYLGPVDAPHHRRAFLIEEMGQLEQPAKILELGAGGGQTAAALANLGHEVTMIELLEESVECALELANQIWKGSIHPIQGDFYEYDFEPEFDLICYFDSFGIGEDADQRRLLKRIASWLKPQGSAIIEIGSTWHWAGPANGFEMDLGGGMRAYSFDAENCRLIDRWWLPENPEEVYHQSLRCYTPADLKLLLEGTGLKMTKIQAGGTVDYENLKFREHASLAESMTYFVRLEKA